MVDKIEQFLFDIIGLFIPGLVFVLILNVITFLFGISPDISNIIKNWDSNMQFFQIPYLMPITFIVFVYLLGHTIKVLSIYFYRIGSAIFDKNINILIGNIKNWILNFIQYDEWYKWIKNLFKLIGILEDIIKQIFTFDDKDSYHPKCEKCFDQVKDILKKEYKIEIESNDWFLVYKIADTIMDNENIKSPSHTFLAKYNFYRSMSFTFFASLALSYYLSLGFSSVFFNPSILIIILVIFWFSFHSKYKRYWMLCGNEALLALFYFFAEKKKNNKGIQND